MNWFGFDIYLPCSKHKGWLDDESDPTDDEGEVEDLEEAARLFEEEAGEEGNKHLIQFVSLSGFAACSHQQLCHLVTSLGLSVYFGTSFTIWHFCGTLGTFWYLLVLLNELS